MSQDALRNFVALSKTDLFTEVLNTEFEEAVASIMSTAVAIFKTAEPEVSRMDLAHGLLQALTHLCSDVALQQCITAIEKHAELADACRVCRQALEKGSADLDGLPTFLQQRERDLLGLRGRIQDCSAFSEVENVEETLASLKLETIVADARQVHDAWRQTAQECAEKMLSGLVSKLSPLADGGDWKKDLAKNAKLEDVLSKAENLVDNLARELNAAFRSGCEAACLAF